MCVEIVALMERADSPAAAIHERLSASTESKQQEEED